MGLGGRQLALRPAARTPVAAPPVYRHEIRPALTKGAVAMDKIFGKAPGSA